MAPTLKISSPVGSSNNLSKATAHLATLPSTEFTILHVVTLAEEEWNIGRTPLPKMSNVFSHADKHHLADSWLHITPQHWGRDEMDNRDKMGSRGHPQRTHVLITSFTAHKVSSPICKTLIGKPSYQFESQYGNMTRKNKQTQFSKKCDYRTL